MIKRCLYSHDQLNLSAWPDWVTDEKPLLIFIESREKGEELPHHKMKATFVLSSMRHFALECHEKGLPVLYHSTKGHFDDGLSELLQDFSGELTYMMPSEWDSRQRLHGFDESLACDVSEIPNTLFLADPDEWKENIEPGCRMEYFYREMRKKRDYLMDGDQPEGGEWNYDDQNGESLPKNHPVPDIPVIEPDDITQEVIEMVEDYFPNHFGKFDHFPYAVTRSDALQMLEQFIHERLDEYGPYEDALNLDDHQLFHSYCRST